MTVEEFQKRKTQLAATYGKLTEPAERRKKVQAYARLYVESRFTERALAELEGMAQSHMHKWLVFGRFLEFLSSTGTQEYSNTERSFRAAWKATDKTLEEVHRFQAIVEAMEKEKDVGKPAMGNTRALAKQLIAHFADGKWHPVDTMAEEVGHDMHTVRAVMDRIVTHGSFKTFAESRPAAKGLCHYRLVKGGKHKIDVIALQSEVEPLLQEMEGHANGHPVHFSQTSVRAQVAQLRKLIARLAR
jgi:hypothetical protein